MKNVKRFTALCMAAVMAVSMVGCGKNADAPAGKTESTAASTAEGSERDTLNIAVNNDIGGLSPYGVSESAALILPQIYEPLFDLDYDMQLVPVIAESWDKVDGTHYTIHLKSDVTDSAGNKFTASDALFTLKHAQEDSNFANYVANIDFEKTKVTDDTTLDLYFIDQNAYSFNNLSGVRMITEAAWNASSDGMVNDPVGTGAYVLDEYIAGSSLKMKAREDYREGAPAIKEITYSVIAEPSQATTALETGEVQVVAGLQNSDISYIDGMDNFTVTNRATIQSMSMFLNSNESSILSNPEIRKAICYSVDNASINDVVYGGFAAPSTACVSTAMRDYSDNMTTDMYTTCDVEKAKQILADAGVSGGTIRIATDGSTQETGIAEILQRSLMELGFDAEINNYDSATIWDVASDPTQWDIEINITSAPSGYGMDSMYAFLSMLNWSQWSDASYDKFVGLYKEAISANTPEECQSKTEEAIRIVEDEARLYSFVQLTTAYAFDKSLNFRVWGQASILAKDLKFS